MNPSNNILTVNEIDFCIPENGTLHHTNLYDLMTKNNPQLVVRRGQPFYLDIVLNRPFLPDTDDLSFILTVTDEENPSYVNGTLIEIPLIKDSIAIKKKWAATIESQNENHLKVKILSSYKCIIAPWRIEIDTLYNGIFSASYLHTKCFYILFNPWCSNDSVFMEDEEQRKEYVLLDTGIISRGSYNRPQRTAWKYAQFEKDILDCSLFIIREIGKMKGVSRSDPIRVSRVISAVVNANDDMGVVEGNWKNNFSGGKAPVDWIGSMEILQKYYKTKMPVKYGQCWVFAGVLTTVCRAVGIPCRAVTVYSSAHDTQASLTIDYFCDEDGNYIKHLMTDSIWNYHVWNDVWMQRPDIGSEFNGWQAIDSTPQERSENLFRCGPTSLAAIKMGDILKPYDGSFLFAEVNADVVYWKYNGAKEPPKLLSKDKKTIGSLIVTKEVGKWKLKNISSEYKCNEDSEEERAVMLKALQQSKNRLSGYYLNDDFNEIQFELILKDDVNIGKDFNVVFKVMNHSHEKEHEVKGKISIATILYTGEICNIVKTFDFVKVMQPYTTEIVKVKVTFDEYYEKLVDQCAFNVKCFASIVNADYDYFAEDDFRVRKPDIKLTIKSTPLIGKELEVFYELENPLPIPLTDTKFIFEGCGEKQTCVQLKENIETKSFASGFIKIEPKRIGEDTIVGKFISKEMNDVDGFLAIVVNEEA